MRAIAMLRRAYPAGHMDVAHALRNLGFFLNNRGRFEAAEPLWRETMALYLRTGGPDGLGYAGAMSQLGKSLAGQKRYAEAERLLREALTLEFMKRSAPNPVRSRARLYLGVALAGQRKYDEAEPLLVEVQRSTLPLAYNASERRSATLALISLYEAQGRLAEAAALRETARTGTR
jgi:tetratricopeptide (TPR) repeat protein